MPAAMGGVVPVKTLLAFGAMMICRLDMPGPCVRAQDPDAVETYLTAVSPPPDALDRVSRFTTQTVALVGCTVCASVVMAVCMVRKRWQFVGAETHNTTVDVEMGLQTRGDALGVGIREIAAVSLQAAARGALVLWAINIYILNGIHKQMVDISLS